MLSRRARLGVLPKRIATGMAGLRLLMTVPLMLAALVARPALAAPVTPPDFTIENAFPGVTFNTPTAIAFLPDGRLLVAEKRGLVWVVDGGVKQVAPLWDGQNEVLSNGDRGLIAIAADPNYATNRRVYFFYTVDPDGDGAEEEIAAFSRIVRYQTALSDSNVVDPASRTVLVGETWAEGFASPTPYHAVGTLRFGADGSLLASHGDGAHYEFVDAGGHDPDQFLPGRTSPREDIGAFRSRDPVSYGGKVLRINPETGHGYAGNPYGAGDVTRRQAKVWSYGLRTPFRFCVRPGTGAADTSANDPGTLYIGDVGHNAWEEINVAASAGLDFGWPCREGLDAHLGYQAAAPAHHACGGTAPTEPTFAWSHTDSARSIPFGVGGNCTAGGVFYTNGNYPASYEGRLFFGDFARGWLKVATLDAADQIVQSRDFATGLEGPVDWALEPQSSDLFYASIYTGEVRRLRYIGGGGAQPPVAVASANPPVGVAPANIPFSSLGSYDPEGSDPSYTWSFGDGQPGSSEPHPTHLYHDAGVYQVILTVTAGGGSIARDTMTVVVTTDSGFPVTGVLDDFEHHAPDDHDEEPLGPPWAGSTWAYVTRGGSLVLTGPSAYTTWDGAVYGPNQEVFMDFDSVSVNAPEQNLLLKLQSISWSFGTIQVVHDAQVGIVVVNTYTPGVGWANRGGPWRNVYFQPGDRFGARAYENGVVEVYRNDEVIGVGSVEGWPFHRNGGRIGVQMRAAPDARIEDFGGGNVPVQSNTPPRATIHEPLDGSFFVSGETVRMVGSGDDDEDAPGSLTHLWNVTIRHNNHQHPEVQTFHSAVDSFVADNHDDGTGISLFLKHIVTDTGGLSDTAVVEIHPDVDLEPSALTVWPEEPDGVAPTSGWFTLHNHGGMPSPGTPWRLMSGATVVASGEAMAEARDSVVIAFSGIPLAAVQHTLTLTIDPDDVLYESDEANNSLQAGYAPLGFPASRVRDRFEGSNGALDDPWTGTPTGLRIIDRALTSDGNSANAIWPADFGVEQEVFARFESVTDDALEHTLYLKVQGASRANGAIQVVWAAHQSVVVVNSFTPGSGWARHGGPWRDMRFEDGDLFGARARADGSVTVYRNQTPIGTASIASWAFADSGGRIGLAANGASATRWIDFGGGDIGAANQAPVAAVVSPGDGGHYVAGHDLLMLGEAADAEDEAGDLRFVWRVRSQEFDFEHHGPAMLVRVPAVPGGRNGPVDAQLIVRDGGGLTDTTEITLHPEIDLEVRDLAAEPADEAGGSSVSFTLANRGRMPAHEVSWTLLGDHGELASGATDVSAGQSQTLRDVAWVSGSRPAGLRVVTDSLDTVRETDEANNVQARSVWPIPFPSTGLIDDFERTDGPIGSPWIGYTTGFEIRNRALALSASSAYALWDGAIYGAEQEAWMRLDSVAVAAPEHDLLLKVQGPTWTMGAVQVVWSALQSLVVVNSFDPVDGWNRAGGPWHGITFVPGDMLGARALGDGTVYVFKNDELIGTGQLGAWPGAGRGGRVGLILGGAAASRIGDFGGGEIGSPRVPAQRAAVVGRESVALAFHPARPNPTTGRVAFGLDLPARSRVAFEIYDLQGRRVWSEPERSIEPGRHVLTWDGVRDNGRSVAIGVYMARVRVEGRALTRRFAVVR